MQCTFAGESVPLWVRREGLHQPVEKKIRREGTQSITSGRQPPSAARGRKGLASPSYPKGYRGSSLPRTAPTTSLT